MATTTPETPAPPPSVDLLSAKLFKVVSVILVFIAMLLVTGLGIQTASYWGGLRAATAAGSVDAPVDRTDHAAVITYARGLGAAFVKTSSLFLGFILIFTGTLYVLRTTEAVYKLQVSGGKAQSILQTTSPGLVIVTLGVALSIVALTTKSEIDYQKTTQLAEPPSTEAASPSPSIKPGTWSAAPDIPGEPVAPTKERGH